MAEHIPPPTPRYEVECETCGNIFISDKPCGGYTLCGVVVRGRGFCSVDCLCDSEDRSCDDIGAYDD